MAEVTVYDSSMFIWLEKSGYDRRNSTRKFAYAIRGVSPVDYRILAQGTRYSALPAITVNGLYDVKLVEGSVNGEVFQPFIDFPLYQFYNHSTTTLVLSNGRVGHACK